MKASDVLIDADEVHKLPPPRCSSADPLFYAVRNGDVWRIGRFWLFAKPKDFQVDDDRRFGTKEEAMRSLAMIYAKGPDPLQDDYRRLVT